MDVSAVITNAVLDGERWRVDGAAAAEVTTRLKDIGGGRLHAARGRATSVTALQSIQYDRFVPPMLEALPADAVALDCGCGDGRGLRWLAAAGVGTSIGLDLGAEALESCREIDPTPGLVLGDIRDCALAGGCLDVVLAIESLYYAGAEYEAVVRKLACALKDGGSLITADTEPECGALFSALRGRLEDVPELLPKLEALEDIGGLTRVRNIAPVEKAELLGELGLRRRVTHGISALPVLLMTLAYDHPNGEELRSRVADSLRPLLATGETELNRIQLSWWTKG